jgi:hypothetical protein
VKILGGRHPAALPFGENISVRQAARLIISAALLPGVLALSACSSSSPSSKSAAAPAAAAKTSATATPSGNIGLSQNQLIAAIRTAAGSATFVHVKGNIASSGENDPVDMQLAEDGDSMGTVGSAPLEMTFIVDGETSYLQCTSNLVSMTAFPCTGLLNKWLSIPMSDNQASPSIFDTNMTFSQFLTNLTDLDGVTTAPDGTGKVNGQTVAQYSVDSTTDGTSVMSLPASGPALPIQMVGTGSNSGTVVFTWNQPVAITDPPAGQVVATTQSN